MEINITNFVLTADPKAYAASAAERGANVGKETWHAALEAATIWKLVYTAEDLLELREWVLSLGGWDAAETEAFTVREVNALLIQFIAGAMREVKLDKATCHSWKATEEDAGCLYSTENLQFFFYAGN